MRTLRRIKRELNHQIKATTCDDVCVGLHIARRIRDELNAFAPKNKKQGYLRDDLLDRCERFIDWCDYWGERIM